MPDLGGLEVLAKCKELQPDAEVILVTGHGTIESAVQAMQRGAFNYLLKPLGFEAASRGGRKCGSQPVLAAGQCGAASSAGRAVWL